MNAVRRNARSALVMSLLPLARIVAQPNATCDQTARPSAQTFKIDSTSAKTPPKATVRITPRTATGLCFVGFNFVRFEPVVSTEVKDVPGYAYLEGLWAQVLGWGAAKPAPSGGAADRIPNRSPFLVALDLWRKEIAANEQTLQGIVGSIPVRVYLDSDERQALRGHRATIARGTQNLEERRRAAAALILTQYAMRMTPVTRADTAALRDLSTAVARLESKIESANGAPTAGSNGLPAPNDPARRDSIDAALREIQRAHDVVEELGLLAASPASPIEEAYYAQELYDAEIVHHKELAEKMRIFSTRAGHAADGRVIDLASQKAGTIVTVSVRAKALRENDAKESEAIAKAGTTVVTYYVQSTRPLVFHAGAVYTRLNEFDYEAVAKGLAGRDVFQQIAKPVGGSDATAYMSWVPEWANWGTQFAAGATLGTGVKDLGKQLYVGLTFKFTERALVTAGVFSKSVTESDGRALSATEPNLFDGVKRVTAWGRFIGLSVTPF